MSDTIGAVVAYLTSMSPEQTLMAGLLLCVLLFAAATALNALRDVLRIFFRPKGGD